MLKQTGFILQIAFTYMGTIVGAGFATGQEILQFFTRYGNWAVLMIIFATCIFIWLGCKMMLLAGEIKARSYEDMNKALFGDRYGRWISHFMLIVLLGVNSVMLAGAGTIFTENWNVSYQTGLLITLIGCYFLLRKGMNAILTVNSIVVPVMLLFTIMVVIDTFHTPGAGRWVTLATDHSPLAAWASPFLYTAFNLSMSQAVLVPLGAEIRSRRTIVLGSWVGGIGIGFMLLAGHIALSLHMPGIQQYEIPMSGIARHLGSGIQLIYIFLIFAEIFTTLIADIYGLTLQLQERLKWPRNLLILFILSICYLTSQLGFGPLLTTLYPLFGFVSLGWLVLMIRKKLSHTE
ncbi:membrane protein [Paenibacillus beijingensis]|uniref:Membrane protein n=1 Tax=Paenibacillus beijingensis TaxID=1126833 RepID=A0A0D5ND64_9BACL|nr:membrane protein [Paenibacillus beijingensis]AJY73334.1 membrane protein [Paenibacillus beijingensis]